MNTNFDIDMVVCKKLFWALMLLASGVKCFGMLTVAYTIIGWGCVITSIAYIVYMIVMVSLIKSRG